MTSLSNKPFKTQWIFLFTSMFLIVFYFVIAKAYFNFQLPKFDYIDDSVTFLFGVHDLLVYSQFWKILLLLPGTILLAVALSETKFRLNFLSDANYKFLIGPLLVISAVMLIISTQFIFHETEVTDDENAYDFQAKTILLGRITNPPPPTIDNFNDVFIINDGKIWVGKYNLGHPLIIALGMAIGNRYIFTVLLSILTLLLFYFISLDLYGDRKTAILSICLAAVSPFFYMVSSSRLSHTTSLFFLALFMFLFIRSRNMNEIKKIFVFALLAGISFGYAFNVRPLTAIGFALPVCIMQISDLYKRRKNSILIGSLFIAGFGITFALTLWYNHMITGNSLFFPFHYYDIKESLGFGIRGTFIKSLRNLVISIGRLNPVLLGLPVSFIFVFCLLFAARKKAGDYLLLGILCSFAFAYLFYYSPGVYDLGPVYYYELMLPLLLLSARGIFILHNFIVVNFKNHKMLVPFFVLLSFLFSLMTYVPDSISHISRLTKLIRSPYEAVEAANVHNALIMIKSLPKTGWVIGYRCPSPKFDDDVIYCRISDSTSNNKVMNYFGNRMHYELTYHPRSDQYELKPMK